MIESPCYLCPERKALCHGVCDRYKAYADEREKEKAVLRSEREKYSQYQGYMTNKITAMKKGNYYRKGKKNK